MFLASPGNESDIKDAENKSKKLRSFNLKQLELISLT
jgi:hypothetical protein